MLSKCRCSAPTEQLSNRLRSQQSFAVAAAARNVYSCLIGAVASAVVVPMEHAMGNGWTYTIFAIFLLGSLLGPHWAMKHGMARRAEKEAKH